MSDEIRIQESCDDFVVVVDGKRFRFHQEDNKEGLVDLFKHLGYTDVEYEEVY